MPKKNKRSASSKSSGSSSRGSSKKSKSRRSAEKRDTINEAYYEPLVEYDVDSRILRSENNRPTRRNRNPKEVSTESSRIIDVVEAGFNPELSEEDILPDFGQLTPDECVRSLGELMGIKDHENNLVSFWILDTLSEVVRQSTKFNISQKNQKLLVAWLGYVLKGISINGGTRQDLFSNIIDVLMEAAEEFNTGDDLPDPKKIYKKLLTYGIDNPVNNADEKRDFESWPAELSTIEKIEEVYSSKDLVSKGILLKQLDQSMSKNSNAALKVRFKDDLLAFSDKKMKEPTFGETQEEVNQIDPSECQIELIFLTEQLYKLFANRFLYEVIKSTFSSPPQIIPVTIIENMNVPKVVKHPVISQEKTPQTAGTPKPKSAKGKKGKSSTGGKGDKKSTATKEKKKSGKSTAASREKKDKGPKSAKGKSKSSTGDKKGKKKLTGDSDATADKIPSFLRENSLEVLEKQKESIKYEQILPLADAITDQYYEKIFAKSTASETKKDQKKTKKGDKNKSKTKGQKESPKKKGKKKK